MFSAHYDAYGMENGKIYHGAADNALGVAEMLAVAEAFSKMPEKPKRSLVFIAVTGEEYGLYGSRYWAKKPTWDIKKVSANLNLDGVGTEVYAPSKHLSVSARSIRASARCLRMFRLFSESKSSPTRCRTSGYFIALTIIRLSNAACRA